MLQIITAGESGKLHPGDEGLAGARLAGQIHGKTMPEFEAFKGETVFFLCLSSEDDPRCSAEKAVVSVTRDRILFLCRNKRTTERIRELTSSSQYPLDGDGPEKDPLKILQAFFNEVIRMETLVMEDLEDRITESENRLILNEEHDAASKILEFRKQIRRLKKVNEPVERIVQGFYENDNGLLDEPMLRHFKILADKMDRLLDEIQNLHEYVSQLREAYQAQIDIQQNSLMKVFTVVAAIFLPLTLLVGWYGMNLRMPEYEWPWGYPFVAGLSLLILAGGLLFFHKKKWL